MKLPKMTLKKLDPAKVFNSLHIVDTTNAGLPTSYYLLTPDQRAYIDELINICETYFQHQIDDLNEDLHDVETTMTEHINQLECAVDEIKYTINEINNNDTEDK